MNRILMVPLVGLWAGTVAFAQTKISGTVQCSKPDQAHSVEIGDRPNHSFQIVQGKCTWTKPAEIGGTQFKEDLVTGFAEVRGNKSRGRGYVVNTLANGDRSYVRTQGTTTLKDGVTESAEGKWTFIGGTGKLKGVKGSGTYKGTGGPDGVTYEVEGQYELPK